MEILKAIETAAAIIILFSIVLGSQDLKHRLRR